jgi:hypothetical protein
MRRLIEIEQTQDLPPDFTLGVGDVLKFWATGGRVESGAGVVELFGPLLTSVVAANGEILSPMGGPNVVLLHALRLGRATVDLVTGDPWRAVRTQTLKITVAP